MTGMRFVHGLNYFVRVRSDPRVCQWLTSSLAILPFSPGAQRMRGAHCFLERWRTAVSWLQLQCWWYSMGSLGSDDVLLPCKSPQAVASVTISYGIGVRAK
jgi:hypothetical protein